MTSHTDPAEIFSLGANSSESILQFRCSCKESMKENFDFTTESSPCSSKDLHSLLANSIIPWHYFGTSSQRALANTIMREFGVNLDLELGIPVQFLLNLKISEITDQRHFGSKSLSRLLDEIYPGVLAVIKSNVTTHDQDIRHVPIEITGEVASKIQGSPTIESLVQNLLESLEIHLANLYDTITAKFEIEIYRLIIPWAIDRPRPVVRISRQTGIDNSTIVRMSEIGKKLTWKIENRIPIFDSIADHLLESDGIENFRQALIDDEILIGEIKNLGRIRFLATALLADDLVKDYEGAIYRWSYNA